MRGRKGGSKMTNRDKIKQIFKDHPDLSIRHNKRTAQEKRDIEVMIYGTDEEETKRKLCWGSVIFGGAIGAIIMLFIL